MLTILRQLVHVIPEALLARLSLLLHAVRRDQASCQVISYTDALAEAEKQGRQDEHEREGGEGPWATYRIHGCSL